MTKNSSTGYTADEMRFIYRDMQNMYPSNSNEGTTRREQHNALMKMDQNYAKYHNIQNDDELLERFYNGELEHPPCRKFEAPEEYEQYKSDVRRVKFILREMESKRKIMEVLGLEYDEYTTRVKKNNALVRERDYLFHVMDTGNMYSDDQERYERFDFDAAMKLKHERLIEFKDYVKREYNHGESYNRFMLRKRIFH